MHIRPMTEADLMAVVALWQTTKRAAYPYLPLEQSYSFDDNLHFFRDHIFVSCDIWLAEQEQLLLGFLAIRGSYIDRLYILPSAQQQGIGTALIAHAKLLSPTGLELHTHQENHSACAFYEKHGFQAVGFGISPPPESAPDVEYHWRPATVGN